MHIAIFVQDFAPETGAGPARITELAAEWIRLGHEVSVVTAFPNRRLPGQRDGTIPPPYKGRLLMREEWNGIKVYRSWLFTSPKRGFVRTMVNNLTFAATSLVHALASLPRPDVLVASGPPYFAQFSGALVGLIKNVPLVLEIRDLWPDYVAEMGVIRQKPLLDLMFATERWLLRRARSVTVVTDSFKHRIVQKGVAADAIDVVPNGVDTSRYYPSDERLALHELSLAPGTPLVGYLGTFGAGQGLNAVIEAARVLRARGVRAHFALVGDGPDRAALEADLAARPVEGVTLHSPIPRDATRALYNSCDVVLVPHASLPVLGDTVPSKIFEVMACSRPLVAALRGEGARIVERSKGGVLATPGDAESIAASVERVLRMGDVERAEMGRAGRKFALAEYDRGALARRYLELLKRAAAR
ncbi:MAG: glycosyltransferase family 4 protein [Gemmatimonadaceae bacterium]